MRAFTVYIFIYFIVSKYLKYYSFHKTFQQAIWVRRLKYWIWMYIAFLISNTLYRMSYDIHINLPKGYPMAKSLLWVQKIAKIPALPRFRGLNTDNVIIKTLKNTILFDINIDRRKIQLTELRSNLTRDMKIRLGKENVPTNIFMPFTSVSNTQFIRPAKYLKNILS